MTNIRLFHIPGACSRVALAALEMSGAEFDVEIVNIVTGGNRTPEYLAINPAGQVPALLIDGEALTENVAIIYTLATMFPDRGILPLDGPLASGRALSRLIFCSSQLHPQVSASLFPTRYCDVTEEATKQVGINARNTLKAKLLTLESVLGAQDWLLDIFSIADVYLFWITARLDVLEIDTTGLEGVVAHSARVKAQPLVQRVLARENELAAKLEQSGFPIPPPLRARMVLD